MMSSAFNLHTGLSSASDNIVSGVERVQLTSAAGGTWTWKTGATLREPVAYFVQPFGGTHDVTLISGDALGMTVQFEPRIGSASVDTVVVNLIAVGQP
jgi:hypothetical protein